MNRNVKLVWSDDPRDKVGDDPPAKAAESTAKWSAVFRLEKNGRGGKTVTVLDQLPRNEEFIKNLCKELKSKCGSGGTYSINEKFGVIEIQGDQRTAIKAHFDKKGFKYRGV